jgi:hypothetical protein
VRTTQGGGKAGEAGTGAGKISGGYFSPHGFRQVTALRQG